VGARRRVQNREAERARREVVVARREGSVVCGMEGGV
jgi:hypothetical protein